MNDHLFQLVFAVVNAFAALAWWAIMQKVDHVKELLTVEQEEMKRRIERVEAKCSDCPSVH